MNTLMPAATAPVTEVFSESYNERERRKLQILCGLQKSA